MSVMGGIVQWKLRNFIDIIAKESHTVCKLTLLAFSNSRHLSQVMLGDHFGTHKIAKFPF